MKAVVVITALAACATAQTQPRGWQPQAARVRQDDSSLIVSTPYYTFEHDLKRGGALARIALTHGRSKNLLVAPLQTTVRLAGKRAVDAAAQQGRVTGDVYSDINDRSPRVSRAREGSSEVVTVEATLTGPGGNSSGVRARTTYRYRWGYVRVRKELIFSNPADVVNLAVISALFHPSLSDYGYRPGAVEEMGNNPFAWTNGQIRAWGKMRPGTHMDLPFRTRFVPRYLVLANHGVEGIEWFVSDNLAQWDYQITGQTGTGFCEIGASTDPLAVRVTVEPLSLPYNPLLERGGWTTLKGAYTFDYYLSVPVLEGHAQKPWLHESARGVRNRDGKEITEANVRSWAESGIREITLHNDGDTFKDGVFWRDGSYPPYPPETMRKMDEMIGWSHKHGIRIAPYFSNHELHQSTPAFKEHGVEWGRMPDDQGNLRPNTYYGSHMCLKSGWLDFLKSSIDRVLKNHSFDGVYYDWNIAMFCNNPRHVGQSSNGVAGGKGLAALAVSPTGHWDIDELLQLMEWTRERVGPNGLLIVHNTLVPMFAIENFADHVVGMEFGYGRLSVSMPPLSELPLEWDWAGARSRAVISTGTVADNAPPRVVRQHALAGLMTAVTPWRANADAIEFVARLKPLGDIERYRFEDWRNRAVRLEGENLASAVYSREGEAFILLANFDAAAKKVRATVRPGELPHPLAAPASAAIIGKTGTVSLDPVRLFGEGEMIEIPGTDVVIVRVR